MGQTLDLCSMKCRGGGQGGGGAVTKGSPQVVPAHPSNKMARLQILDADKVWNLNHFQENSRPKKKKKKKKKRKQEDHSGPISFP